MEGSCSFPIHGLKKDITTKAYNKFRKTSKWLVCYLSQQYPQLFWGHISQAALIMLLEYRLVSHLTNLKASRGSRFTGWEPPPRSMYYLMDQGYHLKNILSPMVIPTNTVIDHLYAHTHKRNIQFHGKVPSKKNENSREKVICCGHQSVWNFWAEGFFFWLCDRGLVWKVGTWEPWPAGRGGRALF